MQHITLQIKCVCTERLKYILSVAALLISCKGLLHLRTDPLTLAAIVTKQSKAIVSHNTNCPKERVSYKCCGTEYLFPCEYYDCYQRTQPDLGLFLIDHVEEGTHLVPVYNMERVERIKCGSHKCFSNRVMLFCNTNVFFSLKS